MGDRIVVHATEGVRAIVLQNGALGAARNAPVESKVEVRWE